MRGPDGVWIQLLGGVQVRCDGRAVKVGGPTPRAILAVLAVEANRIVRTERLLAEVWGPDTDLDRETVYHYLHNLKAALAPAAPTLALKGMRPGYQLLVAESERVIDWHRFCDLEEQAGAARRSGDPDEARALLHHALDLWRGEPLEDLGDLLGAIRRSMATRRLGAAEDLAELELQAAEPGQVVDLLSRLCERHPQRERAAALLVRALGAVGRRDDALAVYRCTRSHTRNALGLDPNGPLEVAYRLVVENRPAAVNRRARRSGLPPADGHFVGRQAELAQIRDIMLGRPASGDLPGEPVICAIDGMAGIGKTQLALRVARAVEDQFPDGTLFVDLLGYTPDAQPLDPAEALSRLLRQLEVPVEQIPQDVGDLAMRYRSALADRAMLIVLDNARTTEQVRPLLPASPSSRVIVTTRGRLTALDDAYPVRLDVLAPEPAGDLFVALSGLPAGDDPATIERIVSRCGRLPLAIRILATRYRARAWPELSELDAQLADEHERLGLMDDGDRSVTAAFTLSYQSLPEDQRRMFRLLSLVPGFQSDVDCHDAAALAGTTVPAAQRLMARLDANGLITQPAPGRYGFHDLLRAYAAQVAAEEPDPDQRGAVTRLLGHYSHTASVAMNYRAPFEPQRRPPTPPAVSPVPPLNDLAQARAWLDAHQHALLAAAAHAATNGWPQHTVHLSRTLFRYLETEIRRADVLAFFTTALHAARLMGDPAAEVHLLNDLSGVHSGQGHNEQAMDDLRQALRISQQTGDRSGEARTLGNLANVHGRLGNYDEAIAHHRQAVRLYVELGDRASESRAITNLCSVYGELGRHDEVIEHLQAVLAQDSGDLATQSSAHAVLANSLRARDRYDEAIEHHHRALEILREFGDRVEEAETLNDLAESLRDAGRHVEALDRYREALAVARHSGNRKELARAHDGAAHAHDALGQPRLARQEWEEALAICTEIGSPKADEIRGRLAALDE